MNLVQSKKKTITLWNACVQGDLEVVKKCLDPNGLIYADIHASNNQALQLAIEYNHVDIVCYLTDVNNKYHIDIKKEGEIRNMLLIAARSKSITVLEKLLTLPWHDIYFPLKVNMPYICTLNHIEVLELIKKFDISLLEDEKNIVECLKQREVRDNILVCPCHMVIRYLLGFNFFKNMSDTTRHTLLKTAIANGSDYSIELDHHGDGAQYLTGESLMRFSLTQDAQKLLSYWIHHLATMNRTLLEHGYIDAAEFSIYKNSSRGNNKSTIQYFLEAPGFDLDINQTAVGVQQLLKSADSEIIHACMIYLKRMDPIQSIEYTAYYKDFCEKEGSDNRFLKFMNDCEHTPDIPEEDIVI